MNYKKAGGIALFVFGLGLMFNPHAGLTGFMIAENFNGVGSLTGLIFIFVGMFLFLGSEKAENELERLVRGKVVSYDKLSKLAKKIGLEVREGKKHQIVYNPETKATVTEIPRHGKQVVKGTYKSIVDALYGYTQKK